MATTVLNKHAKLVGEARAKMRKEVAKRYIDGEAVRQLAESLGRSYGFVHLLLREAGVQMRNRGGARRPKRQTT